MVVKHVPTVIEIHRKLFLRFHIVPTGIYSIFVIYMSSRSEVKSMVPGMCSWIFGIKHIDKIYHFFEYMLLSFLVTRACVFYNQKLREKHRSKNIILVAVVFAVSVCVLFGLSNEIHQLFVANRCFSFFDLLADFLGALLGSNLYCLWWLRRKNVHADKSLLVVQK